MPSVFELSTHTAQYLNECSPTLLAWPLPPTLVRMSTDPSSDFPAVTIADWETSATKALRGKSLDSLTTRTHDDIARAPLYTGDVTPDKVGGLPGGDLGIRGSSASGNVSGWDIRQTHRCDAPGGLAAVSQAILADLERGVTSITLAASPTDSTDLATVLDGVYLDLAGVHLAPGADAAQAQALLDLWSQHDIPPFAMLGSLGFDPLGSFAHTGRDNVADQLAAATSISARLSSSGATAAVFAVDGTVANDAGASDAEEIGAILATTVAYLRALEASGLSAADSCTQLAFTVSVDADQFAGIAKLRAVRQCLTRVITASGGSLENATLILHVQTSATMMTRRDPWVNMLRTTTACFAAAVGGADAITVLPFDEPIGHSDDFGFRIARNTQSILMEESHLGEVIDPAGGSWYVEDFTTQMAKAGWSEFQRIEAEGGMYESLRTGAFPNRVAATAAARESALAHRTESLTGVNEFPDVHETVVERVPVATAADTAMLPQRRRDEAFESLRLAADNRSERPTVFLANMGPVAVHSARAAFAKNLFEVGGIAAISNSEDDDGFRTASDAAAGFGASGSRIVCICSSDKMYAELASETAQKLKAAGAAMVVLAGAPGDNEQTWRNCGVDAFISMGCDIIDVLTACHERLA
jgi:methylmalonyl-CoA mutase